MITEVLGGCPPGTKNVNGKLKLLPAGRFSFVSTSESVGVIFTPVISPPVVVKATFNVTVAVVGIPGEDVTLTFRVDSCPGGIEVGV